MLEEPLPEHGEPADAVLDRVVAEVLPFPFGNGHPRFAGWVNGPPVALSVLVEVLAAAMIVGLAVARHRATEGAVRADGVDQGDRPLVVYTSSEGHSAIAKAVELLGLGTRHLRRLPVDGDRRLRVDARATFSLVAPYLRGEPDPDGVSWLPWFSEYGSEQTRAFRALKVWAALCHHGRAGYAESIARDNRLADHVAALAGAHPELELVAHG